MEINKIIVGNRIRLLRIENGYNQDELAKKLGLNNKSSISQYENGDAIPSDDIKLKICELFNCSLDYLIGKSDNRNPEKSKDLLDLAKMGFNMKNYEPPTEKQKEQIKDLLEVILRDNKKGIK